MYVRLADELPHPPEELLDTLDILPEKYKNYHPTGWWSTVSSYDTNPGLEEFFQEYFDYPIVCRYQLIFRSLPPHIDAGLKGMTKFNYLLEPGGKDIETYFWSDMEGQTLLHTEICEPRTWYELNVGIPHGISNVDTCRFSLVIRTRDTRPI